MGGSRSAWCWITPASKRWITPTITTCAQLLSPHSSLSLSLSNSCHHTPLSLPSLSSPQIDDGDDDSSGELTAEQREFARLLAQAQAGDEDAIIRVGNAYCNGHVVEEDATKACEWLQMAAAMGNAAAQSAVAYFLFGAGTPNKKDKIGYRHVPRAVHWWSKAAAQGDIDAMTQLGARLWEGEEVWTRTAMPGAAQAWLTRGPTPRMQGVPTLQGLPGVAGVPKDITRGLEWMTRAADAGGVQATYRLALAHLNGTLPCEPPHRPKPVPPGPTQARGVDAYAWAFRGASATRLSAAERTLHSTQTTRRWGCGA